MKYLLTTILAVYCLQIQAQDLAIGQWRSHLPYTFAVSVTQSDDVIYFAGEESVFSINKNDNSVELFNTVTGLSDAGIERINFNKHNNTLLIAYTNGNIDFVTEDNSVINISAIKDEGIAGDSRIYHIRFQDQFAWLSTGFGLVKLDMEKVEIRFTTFTGLQVNSTELYEDFIYISTEDGLYRANLNTTELYQANFTNWEKIGETNGLPSAYYSNVNEAFMGKLYADVNDTLYVYDGNEWAFFYHEDRAIASLHGGVTKLIAARAGNFDRINLIALNGTAQSITSGNLVAKAGEAIQDADGVVWIADRSRGAGSFDTATGSPQEYDVDGPYASLVGEIVVHDSEVYVASTSLKPLWQRRDESAGFYHYTQNEWTNYYIFDHPGLIDNGCADIVVAATHPSDGRVFLGSYICGLVEFDGTDFTVYDDSNSTLQRPVNDDSTVRVSGLAFDRDNNLWMSNYDSPTPISVMEPDGTWHAYTPPLSYSFPTQIVVDFNGYKWFAGGGASEGFLVFDDGGTLNDTSDDRYRKIDKNNSVMESNGIKSLALDLDGNMWVGTGKGLVVFECTGQIFDDGCAGRKPVFAEGEDDEYLFKDIAINTIAIDGANQKWIGTDVGLFLLDEDVEEELLEFNTLNSPIFSDEIIDVAIDGNTGEVFIGTGKGIISYRAEATDGKDFFNNVYAFPNPVRPDYEGIIAVKGLTENANIKITDVSGTLVYETTSLGGQAVWDGNDYNGRRASSGVYLVYATSKDGLEQIATKILLMN